MASRSRERRRIGEDDPPERRTVERAVGAAQVRAEPRVDGRRARACRAREHVARDPVRVDDHDARPLAEPAGHRGLAAADRTGQPDAGRGSMPSRRPLLELRATRPRRSPERASTSASSLVTRRISTKFAGHRRDRPSPARGDSCAARAASAPHPAPPSAADRHPSTASPIASAGRAAVLTGGRPGDCQRPQAMTERRRPHRAARPRRPSAAAVERATLGPAAGAIPLRLVRRRHCDRPSAGHGRAPRSIAAIERRRGPSPTTHSSSHTVSSSRRSCETTSSVAGESRMNASIASRAGMSRWFVGSSSSSRFDGWMPSSASSSRDRSPPDSERTSLNTSSPRNRKRAR